MANCNFSKTYGFLSNNFSPSWAKLQIHKLWYMFSQNWHINLYTHRYTVHSTYIYIIYIYIYMMNTNEYENYIVIAHSILDDFIVMTRWITYDFVVISKVV